MLESKREARILISLLLGALAIWVLSPFQPEALYLNFNDELIASYQIEMPQSTIRVYRGSGGATTSFRWNATVQTPGSEEQEFLGYYHSPAMLSLSCSEGAVTLKPFDSTEKELIFTSQQIEGLKGYPMEFSEGKLSGLGGKKFPEPHHYVAGVLMGLIVWILYRGFRAKPLREVES